MVFKAGWKTVQPQLHISSECWLYVIYCKAMVMVSASKDAEIIELTTKRVTQRQKSAQLTTQAPQVCGRKQTWCLFLSLLIPNISLTSRKRPAKLQKSSNPPLNASNNARKQWNSSQTVSRYASECYHNAFRYQYITTDSCYCCWLIENGQKGCRDCWIHHRTD